MKISEEKENKLESLTDNLKTETKDDIIKENGQRETKLEIVTPTARDEISKQSNSEQIDSNFQEFPKLEAFENKEVMWPGLRF